MPAKRIIILERDEFNQQYRAVLWADVPVPNQIAYSDPLANSEVVNITPPELQAIRDGQVAEKVVTWQPSGVFSLALAQSVFEGRWNQFQADISASTNWVDFGRFWNNSGVWQASTGVPLANLKYIPEGQPTFIGCTPVSAFAVNKFHFVLFNNAPIATSGGLVVRIRKIVVQPGIPAVVGAAPSPFTLVRRTGLTTPPSGAGSMVATLLDTAQAIPLGIGMWNAPAVSPSGGTTMLFNEFMPQADELKLSTLDAPTMASIQSFGGVTIYDANDLRPCCPLIVRPGQTLEVQQGATAGLGNCRIWCAFTI